MSETPDSLNLFFKTLMGESERGKIILLASKIEELLIDLLKTFFKPSREKKASDDKVFRRMGLLGTFSARIEMAHRVGLISAESADCLDMLRDIRNDCAHDMTPFTYQKGAHGDKFKAFKKRSYEISGMEKFFSLVETAQTFERIDSKEFPKVDDTRFMMLTMAHMLMLQATLKRLKVVGDSFGRVEGRIGFDLRDSKT